MRRIPAESASSLEGRIVTILWTVAFAAALATFSITFLTHSNTFAIAEPIIRWLAPDASAAEIASLHTLGRKLGHFLIPAIAYLTLVIGPLRNRRYSALALCAAFAALDETLQAFTPARTGSIYDVALDVSGALFSFFVYSLKIRRAAICPQISATASFAPGGIGILLLAAPALRTQLGRLPGCKVRVIYLSLRGLRWQTFRNGTSIWPTSSSTQIPPIGATILRTPSRVCWEVRAEEADGRQASASPGDKSLNVFRFATET